VTTREVRLSIGLATTTGIDIEDISLQSQAIVRQGTLEGRLKEAWILLFNNEQGSFTCIDSKIGVNSDVNLLMNCCSLEEMRVFHSDQPRAIYIRDI
jgi:hypothetical protein